ncbi:MAG TPA: DUF5985 family protein [Candidatus Acidoferrum sp.]|jgi:uncharacterized membrane protein HdeD (DUF308 family)
MILEHFLLGVIATASVTAALFFLKFWKQTRDTFFLSFAAFFVIEAATRVAMLSFARPNEGSPWIYVVRFFALCWILTAIARKNYGKNQ